MSRKTQTTYTMSTMPSWYTNYAQDILANQRNLASRPFTPFDFTQRVAGFNPTQQQGFGMTQQAATGYQPTLDQSQNVLQGTLGRSTLGAAQPMINRAMDTSALQPAYGALGEAGQMTRASTNPMALDLASPYLQQASSMSAAGAAAPGMQAGANLTMQSTSPTGIDMAQPYMQQAAQSSAAGVGEFMNPFMENVVNRYGELGARTLNEQLMPSIMNKYITAGQLRGPTRPGTGTTGAPSGMMTDTARALRDVQEGVATQQQQALSQGYSEALGASQAERARMGQLAQTAGSFGFQQQQALANAGQQMGSLGQQFGALTGQDQQALASIGQQFGALGAGQQQALANAGQQMGQLGGQYASIGQNQQQLMSTLAGQIANMYGQDTANQMAASGQLAQLAQQQQQQGLAGAQAVTGAGNQQQALEQARRDAAYQEFLRASGYDQAQIDQMTRTFGGVAGGVPQGQVSLQTARGPSGSMIGNLAGAAVTLAGASGRP